MNFSKSLTQTLYETYRSAQKEVSHAIDAIAALGPRPEYPVSVTEDTDYNNVTADIASWDNAYKPLKDALDNANAAFRSAELSLFELTPSNQWIHVTSDHGALDQYDVYIGYDAVQRALLVNTTVVTLHFPNVA